jgi:chalcone isomerase-like protein
MRFHRIGTVLLLGFLASLAQGAELVSVEGSHIVYANPFPANIGGKDVNLVLTGTALRKKLVFSVYTIGSFVQEGVKIHSAEELIAVDCPKRLHLVMERDVDGKDMAEAFHIAIRLNYAEPAFAPELSRLMDFMRSLTVKKGDHVWLTYVPGVGLHCQVLGKTDITITNVAFARAVWEIYLGKNNLGEAIKQGLTSRL